MGGDLGLGLMLCRQAPVLFAGRVGVRVSVCLFVLGDVPVAVWLECATLCRNGVRKRLRTVWGSMVLGKGPSGTRFRCRGDRTGSGVKWVSPSFLVLTDSDGTGTAEFVRVRKGIVDV